MFEALHLSPGVLIALAAALVLFVALLAIGKVPLGYNVRNLLVRWWVTLLTAVAFTLVVGLLTFMLMFVNGMQRLTEGSGQPGNVMVLSDGATDELFSNLAHSDVSNVERQPGVETDEHSNPLCSKEVYIVVTQPIASEESGGRRRFMQVRGIDDALTSSKVHGMELYEGGKWFSEAGVQELPGKDGGKSGEQAVQAVLGEGVARELARDKHKEQASLGLFGKVAKIIRRFLGKEVDEQLQVGDVFELGPRKWVVTGIMKSAGSTFGSEIWAKRSLVGPLFGKDQFTCLVLRTKDAPAAAAVALDLRTNFKPAVRAEPETEYYAKLSETNKQFSWAIYVVTTIMAIGGVFGVMNTMFAAISQRTKDIGVLRILGFARWQILVSFFLETLVIALVGGLLGVALGSLFDGTTATSIVSSGQGGGGKTVILKLTLDANILAVGILFTLIMGALGGLIPSLSAMRLRPLESLR
jgi:putative ABC transport system permease protein